MNLQSYRTLVFDCDGVVLDSNGIKSQAFYQAALPYGAEAAAELLAYHKARGGVSRYEKFRHFLSSIVPRELPDHGYRALLDAYAANVAKGMLTCQAAAGLGELRSQTKESTWMIASGGDQSELREIFRERAMDSLFDGGIFGSPDSKEEIFRRELNAGTLARPALFLGDSCYDFTVASMFSDIDFVFLHGWSEVEDWERWTAENRIASLASVAELLGTV